MGKFSEAFVAFDVAKKKHAVAIAGRSAGKFDFSAMWKTVGCRSSGRSRDWQTDTTGCMSASKLGRRDSAFYAEFRLSATIAWWSLQR